MNRAIEVDLGSYIKDPFTATPEQDQKTAVFCDVDFKQWMEKNYPELKDYLEEKYLRSLGRVSLLIFLMCFGAAERICYRLTDGFWMSKVTSSLKPDPRWDVEPLEPAAERAVEKILDQPFHYFGSGGECYVFLSQDGRL